MKELQVFTKVSSLFLLKWINNNNYIYLLIIKIYSLCFYDKINNNSNIIICFKYS